MHSHTCNIEGYFWPHNCKYCHTSIVADETKWKECNIFPENRLHWQWLTSVSIVLWAWCCTCCRSTPCLLIVLEQCELGSYRSWAIAQMQIAQNNNELHRAYGWYWKTLFGTALNEQERMLVPNKKLANWSLAWLRVSQTMIFTAVHVFIHHWLIQRVLSLCVCVYFAKFWMSSLIKHHHHHHQQRQQQILLAWSENEISVDHWKTILTQFNRDSFQFGCSIDTQHLKI